MKTYTCYATGKVAYSNKRHAMSHMQNHRRRVRGEGERRPLSCYLCKDCGLWHVGHTPSVNKV